MYREQFLKRRVNPRQTANILSLMTFFYTIRLFIQGYFRGLEMKDIYDVLPSMRTKRLGNKLEQEWEKEKSKHLKSFVGRALWACFGRTFILLGAVQFAWTMTKTVWTPQALSKLVSYFSPGQTDLTKQDAMFYACTLIGVHFVSLFVKHNLNISQSCLGIRVKAAVSSLLYRKFLKMSSESLSEVSAGKIVTIMTKDLDIFELFSYIGNSIWIALVQTCLLCYLIHKKIGVASFPGIAFFLVIIPLQVLIAKMGYRLRLKCSKKTDERLELIREILSAIKIIKMYTWESFFEAKVNAARKAELIKLHNFFYTKVWINIIGRLCSTSAFFIFLVTYIWMGNDITAEVVYYILSCTNDLESSFSGDFAFGFSRVAELFAALQRIEGVLQAEELPVDRSSEDKTKPVGINFRKVSIKIGDCHELEVDSLNITKGLNAVVGHVGTGKTTFLKAILRECQTTGEVRVNGRVSYASQEPWLFPSTIRNNILFGEQYNQSRYQEVLRVCCLDYDLEILPEGDGALVGDRGINLSRGQQARVNLARAIYKNCDIYLLDDCLAALDGRVSDAIFKRCIRGFLRDKLRVFVTNNLGYVRSADNVIEISSRSVQFLEGKASSENFDENFGIVDAPDAENYTTKRLYHETKKSGAVPLRYYRKCVEYGGGFFVFALIVGLFIATQSTASASDKILSEWVTLEQNLSNYKKINETYEGKNSKMGLYAAIVSSCIILDLVKSFSFYYFTRRACVNIHKSMVRNVINATMKFYDSHFVGNILTRFTKDFVTLDETLPFVVRDCLMMLFTAFGGVILLTTVDSILLFESILLLIVAIIIKQFCQPTGRNLERLHVIGKYLFKFVNSYRQIPARSPINGHLVSTLEGLTTIRTYGAQNMLKDEFDKHQDLFNSSYCMVVTNFCSLGLFLDFICKIFTSGIIIQFLILNLNVSVGDVGLAITQSLIITGIITSGITSVADYENLMVSAERILEFTELEEEEDDDEDANVVTDWPKFGSIRFDTVALSYGDRKRKMLNDISFILNSKEKLGIVGRTGAGKSSIIAALFRLYDVEGNITIDDFDIRNLSLKRLRSSISVIPQEPYLFSGTIRENLDPLGLRRDEEIWEVLEELRLKSSIDDLGMKVDKGVSLSAGQKQLLGLARVALRDNKIVVLDEATASVDEETDALIRSTVHKYFKECTVIIIAHKLSSIVSCGKVLVLDKGRIIEFDEPERLMQNENSFLSNIIK